jgi:IclR family acetate operon transcriptional repressor
MASGPTTARLRPDRAVRTKNGAPSQIQSVARAIRLVELVSEHKDGVTATALAEGAGLPLPTAFHLLRTLVAEQVLVKDSHRRYALGPTVGILGEAYLRQESVPEALVMPLRQLADRTGETAYLTAWRGQGMRVLMSVEGAHAVRVAGIDAGPYLQGHARASGKLLLAFGRPEAREAYLRVNPLVPVTARTIVDPEALDAELARIRKRGYSEDREEFAKGVSCLSVPLMSGDVVLAAYTISSPTERFRAQRAELLSALRACTAEAAQALGERRTD